MRRYVLIETLASWLLVAHSVHADQISCIANGSGTDVCTIDYPDVTHSTVTYPGVSISSGDKVTVTATGCVQTGGSGKTWKRYLDPSGKNSDHLYHGLIQIPGVNSSPVRIQKLTGPVTATANGSLELGYEDSRLSDNGYWSHDNGTQNQCADQNTPNFGRAEVNLLIEHATPPFASAGTVYGQCLTDAAGLVHCHIDRPDVTHATETYPAIQFNAGDTVKVQAAGCVQTGGSGKTWKRYVNPSGPNSGSRYHGLISIPGTTSGMVRLDTLIGQTLTTNGSSVLTLGYEDDNYTDNGYWSHDNGTGNQCAGVGDATVDLTITRAGAPAAPFVQLDGIETVQSVQDLTESVPLVAAKQTWARVYLSGNLAPATKVQGTLFAQSTRMNNAVTLSSANALIFSADPLNARRTNWNASLNFLLPADVTAAGTVTLSLSTVELVSQLGAGPGSVQCQFCASPRKVFFIDSPTLRVRLFSVSYSAPALPNGVTTTFTPRQADFDMLNSWLTRAYPTALLDTSTVSIAGTITPPFTDSDCNTVDAQLAAIRSNDIANKSVDGRTHYYALVSDGAGMVTGGFMRGCSNVPDSPNPAATGSGPAGQNAFGDTDASYADWYGGHELGHTFGRSHPNVCGAPGPNNLNFPFPNGTISDAQGTFVALDVGDPSVDGTTGLPLPSPIPTGAHPIALSPLGGTTTSEVMTYCPQPEWPSSYTFEAIRQRLIDENALPEPSHGSSDSGTAPQATKSAIHVIGIMDLTTRTAVIQHVLPLSEPVAPTTTDGHRWD